MRLAKHHWSQEIVTFWCTIGTGGWFGCAKRTYILDDEEQELICYVDRVVPLYMCVYVSTFYVVFPSVPVTPVVVKCKIILSTLKSQGHHSGCGATI